MTKKKKKKKNPVNVLKISTRCFFLFLQNAYKCNCSRRTYVVDVVLEHLFIAIMDSLRRRQFYPRMRQAGRDKKISDRHRKGYSCPMYENGLSQMMKSQIKIFISNTRCLAVIIETTQKELTVEREYQCGIRTRDFQAQKRSYRFSVLSPRLT